jgi:hypothetical protein
MTRLKPLSGTGHAHLKQCRVHAKAKARGMRAQTCAARGMKLPSCGLLSGPDFTVG